MAEAQLKAVIGAETAGFVSGINKAEDSLRGLQEKLNSLKVARLDIVDPAKIAQANQQIATAAAGIERLKNIGKSGFDEFGEAIQKTEQKTETFISGVNNSYSAVRKLAYILPGIGIAGIFNLAFEGISRMVTSIGEATSGFDSQAAATKRAENASKELIETLEKLKTNEDIIGQATGSNAGGIERVRALAAAVRDSNLSYKERQTALTELKETNKAYFGDLTLEENSLKGLTTRVTEYSNALIQEAIVKGFTEEISKQTIEYNKQNDILIKLKSNLDNALKAQAAFKPSTQTTGGSGLGVGAGQSAQTQQDLLAEKVKNANDAFLKQRDGVELLSGAIAGYRGQIDQAVEAQLKFKPLKDVTGAGSGSTPDTLEKTKAALEEILKLQTDLGKSDLRPLFKRLSESVDPTQAELLATKIALVIRNNARDGIKQSITDQEVQLMKEQLSKLLNPDLSSNIDTHIVVRSNIAKEIEKFKEDTGKTLDERLGKNTPAIKTDIKVDPNLIFDEFGRSAVQFSKSVDKISKEFTNILNESLISAIEAVSLNLAGGSLSGLFSDLESIIGQGLESLGKSLLLAFPIIQAAKTAIANAIYDPQLIAIAGVLAIAAGAAIKGLAAKKGIHAFAEGGIVTGPTNALIGEAGPEVVFPLEKLNKFVRNNTGPGSMQLQGSVKINGQDLLVVFNRATKNQGYV